MTTKVGINGFGRIGRLAFRRIAEVSDDLEIVAINDLTSPAMLAHLLKYDTAHGQFDAEVSATDHSLIVNGKKSLYTQKQTQQTFLGLRTMVLN